MTEIFPYADVHVWLSTAFSLLSESCALGWIQTRDLLNWSAMTAVQCT